MIRELLEWACGASELRDRVVKLERKCTEFGLEVSIANAEVERLEERLSVLESRAGETVHEWVPESEVEA